MKNKSIGKSKTNSVLNKDTIRLGFKNLVWGEEPIFYPKELSDILGIKNPRTIYKLLKGEQKITPEQYIITAREAALRGDYSLLDLAVPPGVILDPIEDGETDGSLDNEILEIDQCIHTGRKLFIEGKYAKARPYVRRAKREINTMDKEIKEKLGL